MLQDLAALASINEPGVAPEHIDVPEGIPSDLQPSVPISHTLAPVDVAPSTQPLAPTQMGLLITASSTPTLLAARIGSYGHALEEATPAADAPPQMPGMASLVDPPAFRPVPFARQVLSSEPVAAVTERPPVPPSELIAAVPQPGLPRPSISLAAREGNPRTVVAQMKPYTSRPGIRSSQSVPQFALPGPSIPPQLQSVSDAGLTAAAIGKGGFGSKRKGAGAPGKGAASSVKGWLVSLSVMAAMLAAGGAVIYWAIPAQTMASVRNSVSKTEPDAAAVANAALETPATPTNSLTKQIEVTGFRFVATPNKKPEIHYLVVNHSQLALNDVTVYVTLHANAAKPGQPPLSRFSFRAPNVGPNESKEMSSTIEKISQPITLPEWQDMRVEVSLGQ